MESAQIGLLHFCEIAVDDQRSLRHEERAAAEARQHWMVMACRHDDAAGGQNGLGSRLDDRAELMIESLVHLVEKKDLRTRRIGNRKAKPGAHPLREARDRTFELVAEAAASFD